MTGYQWEDSVFLAMWRELTARYGRDTAREIIRKIMYEAGLIMGQMATEEIPLRNARGVAESWDLLYGPSPECTLEVSDHRYVYRVPSCRAHQFFQKLGVPDEEIAEIADSYCVVDNGFARAFGEDVECLHVARCMKGDPHCEWLHTSGKK